MGRRVARPRGTPKTDRDRERRGGSGHRAAHGVRPPLHGRDGRVAPARRRPGGSGRFSRCRSPDRSERLTVRIALVLGGLLVVLAISIVFATLIGAVSIAPLDVLGAIG